MRTLIILTTIGLVSLLGCSDEKGQQEKEDLTKKNQDLTSQLAERDRFINDVTATINEIHENLEATWAKEKHVVRQTTTTEGSAASTPVELKGRILGRIADMNSVIMNSKKQMASLQKKLDESGRQYAGLQKMVDDLKKDIEAREESINRLNARVSDLETEVSKKVDIITADQDTINHQTQKLNEVYYVVGTKDDLKEKGIIKKEGGVLWGLLGTTTVLTNNFANSDFQTLDKTKDQTIALQGAVEEIVPKRDTSLYTMVQSGDGQTTLKIIDPAGFWRERHLVIVTE